jgi:hypothetical protein
MISVPICMKAVPTEFKGTSEGDIMAFLLERLGILNRKRARDLAKANQKGDHV